MKLVLIAAILLLAFQLSEGSSSSYQRDPWYEIRTFYDECYKPDRFLFFSIMYDLTHPYQLEEFIRNGKEPQVDRYKQVFADVFPEIMTKSKEQKYLVCQKKVTQRLDKESEKAFQIQTEGLLFCLRKFADKYLNDGTLVEVEHFRECYKDALDQCHPPDPYKVGREG
ncbi:unnamed protein product [Callosobruchus maculatus]|nr:unnamed protein product [Callosobruchus maculatus]